MTDLGKVMKMTREDAGLSVQEVSDKIKILSSYIEAIESNDFQSLPSRVYAIGFVRCYADFLNLDSQKLCDTFKEQLGWRGHSDLFHFDQKVNNDNALLEKCFGKHSYRKLAAYVTFIVCLFVGSVFFLR